MNKKMLLIEGVNSKKTGIISNDDNYNVSATRKGVDGELMRDQLESDAVVGQWALIKTFELTQQRNEAGELEDCAPYQRQMVVFIGSFEDVAQRLYSAEIAAEAGKMVIAGAAKRLAGLATVSSAALSKI